jgi:hypothetical protein
MRTVLNRIAISGVVFFGVVFPLNAKGQEADDPAELAETLQASEDDALAVADQDLGDAARDTDKSVKNEFYKDGLLLEGALSAPTPPVVSSAHATPTLDDSLKEIEREVDSLEAQSTALSQ